MKKLLLCLHLFDIIYKFIFTTPRFSDQVIDDLQLELIVQDRQSVRNVIENNR